MARRLSARALATLSDPSGQWPVFEAGVTTEEARQVLLEAELSDGLPLVVPTAEGLDAMLEGVVQSDAVITQMPPLFGDLRPDAVAYQSVIAGCEPGVVPVLVQALENCTAPEFNLLGLLTTTGTPAVALVVHGKPSHSLGLNSGTNCLGPGNRANATLGRALSLCLRNIAGARELVGDMATMGQPGKYTFCFAEDTSTAFGSSCELPPEGSVTVIGVSGTMEVLPQGEKAEEILKPVAIAMAGAQAASGGGRPRQIAEQTLLLPPELVERLNRLRWSRRDVQAYLFKTGNAVLSKLEEDRSESGQNSDPIAPSAEHIRIVVTGGAGVKMTCLVPWAGVSRSVHGAVRPR